MGAKDLTPDDGLDVGDGRELKATYTTSGGAAASVSAGDVTLTITDPSGTDTTHTGSDLDVSGGVVTYEHIFDAAGLWYWVFSWSDGSSLPQVQGAAARVTLPDQ